VITDSSTGGYVNNGYSGQWISNSAFNNKKRFTYGTDTSGVGRCWDYSECYCSCASTGDTFATDFSKGFGMTGYGYYYSGQWYSWIKPFAEMTGTEKAQQCQVAFSAIGRPCAAVHTNLICWYATDYPKPRCATQCVSDANAVNAISNTVSYNPPTTLITANLNVFISMFYGPWGGSVHTYPVWTFTATQYAARCQYSYYTTTTVTAVNFATVDDGASSSAVTFSTSALTNAGVSTKTQTTTNNAASFTNRVLTTIYSAAGPYLQGGTITSGCSTSTSTTPSQCFGPTAASLASQGTIMVAVGIVLIVIACCLCGVTILCFAAIAALLFK